MTKSMATALVMLPLLGGGVPTKAATIAPLINQAQNGAIVKVSENCGNGYFRDQYGHCRYIGYESPWAPAHEGCPPYWHYAPWVNHSGGRCVPN
jgi:hypothetical protein